MKKVLLFISMLLAAVLITSLYSCTQDGGDNDNRHRQGNGGEESLEKICEHYWEVINDVDIYYNKCKRKQNINSYNYGYDHFYDPGYDTFITTHYSSTSFLFDTRT